MKEILNGLLSLSPKKITSLSPGSGFFSGTFLNGEDVLLPSHNGEQLLILVSGEADCYNDVFPVRMTPGSWINLVPGQTASLRIYRTTEPVIVLLFQSKKNCTGNYFAFGNFFDLPRWHNGQVGVFAFECKSISGTIEFYDSCEEIDLNHEDFLLCLDGKIILKDMIFQKNNWLMLKSSRYRLKSLDSCVIMRLSPNILNLSKEYKDWLNSQYGILWDEGLHYFYREEYI